MQRSVGAQRRAPSVQWSRATRDDLYASERLPESVERSANRDSDVVTDLEPEQYDDDQHHRRDHE